MLTVGVIILEHLTSGVVLKLFRPAKSKTGPSFVGVMRLVTGLSEGEMYGARDCRDSFPQLMANSRYTS